LAIKDAETAKEGKRSAALPVKLPAMYHIQNQRPCQDCPIQGRTRGADGVYRAERRAARETIDPTREAMLRFDAYDTDHAPRFSGGLHHLY